MKKKAIILAVESFGATNYNDLPYQVVIHIATDPAFASSLFIQLKKTQNSPDGEERMARQLASNSGMRHNH